MKKVLFNMIFILLCCLSAFAENLQQKNPALAPVWSVIEEYTNVIADNPNDANAYCSRGIVYALRGQYDLAVPDFDKAIEINPNYVYAFYMRGEMYGKKGDTESAIKDFNKAIELSPRYENPYRSLGLLYTNSGQFDLAITIYKKEIECIPHTPIQEFEVSYRLAHAYEKKRTYNNAIEVYRKFIKKTNSIELISRAETEIICLGGTI